MFKRMANPLLWSDVTYSFSSEGKKFDKCCKDVHEQCRQVPFLVMAPRHIWNVSRCSKGMRHRWSPETWSRSWNLSRDPFLRVTVSKASGLVLVSASKTAGIIVNAYWLETLNTTTVRLCKTLIKRACSLLYLHVRNYQNRWENARNKKIGNYRQNPQLFKCLVYVSNCWWSLGLEGLTRSQSRRLRSWLPYR